VTNY